MAELFRYKIEVLARREDEDTMEQLRELGMEGWELVSVIPGRQGDPGDGEHATYFFKRDASTDIGL